MGRRGSHLGLFWLPMSYKKDAKLIWGKIIFVYYVLSFKCFFKGSGYAVWRTILQGAKKRRPSLRMNHMHYSKTGTYEDALKDFRSVQPTNVQYVDEPSVSQMSRVMGKPFCICKNKVGADQLLGNPRN